METIVSEGEAELGEVAALRPNETFIGFLPLKIS
jgi:hypothetical protein